MTAAASSNFAFSPGELWELWQTPEGCYLLLDRLETQVADPEHFSAASLPYEFFLLKGITYFQLALQERGKMPETAIQRLLELATDNLKQAQNNLPPSAAETREKRFLTAVRTGWLAAYDRLKETGQTALLDGYRLSTFAARFSGELGRAEPGGEDAQGIRLAAIFRFILRR